MGDTAETMEWVVYAGRRWHRRNAYFSTAFRNPDGSQRTELLHRRVWADAHGAIPDGYVVHHKDDNPKNNEIENLELMERSAHNSMHKRGRLPATHRLQVFVCRHCGSIVERVQMSDGRWCSGRCKDAGRYAAGYRSPQRRALAAARAKLVCCECGSSLNAKNSRARFCSSRCAKRTQRRARVI